MTNEITLKQKQIIHIIKNKYDLSDKKYQDLMYENFGVMTSVYLTEKQADEFIHLLNYKYSDEYKYGYNKCLERFQNVIDLETVFKEKYKPSDFELRIFRMLDTDKQKELLNL